MLLFATIYVIFVIQEFLVIDLPKQGIEIDWMMSERKGCKTTHNLWFQIQHLYSSENNCGSFTGWLCW